MYLHIKKKNKKTKRQKEHLVCCRKGQVEKSSVISKTCVGERPQNPMERLHPRFSSEELLLKKSQGVNRNLETCNNPTRRKVSDICFTLFHH